MKQQKTVESRVVEILKECPMSRYDDMLLILHYYNQTDIYLPEIFRLRILYLITEHTDFLVLKPYAGQGREYSPFFLSIHGIRRKKSRAAVFLL